MSIISGLVKAAKTVVTAVTPTKAKIQNVGDTLKAALTGKGVTASIPGVGTTVNKAVSSIASNPYTSAAVAAVAIAPKAAIAAVSTAFKALPTSGKVATVAALPVAASVVVTKPSSVKSVAQLPSSVTKFASNVATFTDEPSIANAKQIASENPIITAALGAGVAYVAGKGVVGAATALSTMANTQAIKESTQATESILTTITQPGLISELQPAVDTSLVPLTPATQVMGVETKATGVLTKKRKKRKATGRTPSLNQRMRVNIYNQTKSFYSKSAIYS